MKTTVVALIVCCVVLAVKGKSFRLTATAPFAKLGEYPHQISIQFHAKHICGGSLITTSHVITAAHCIYQIITGKQTINPLQPQWMPPLDKISVEVGSTEIGSGQRYSIKRYSIHPDYIAYDLYAFLPNDIAVLTLRSPVTVSAYVHPISLPEPMSEVPVSDVVTVTGFGQADPIGPSSRYLRKMGQWVMDQSYCSDYFYTHPKIRKMVSSANICGYSVRNYAVCYGDSGGPLTYNNKIVGVVSGGLGDCDGTSPDVYTKVSHYLDYINYEIEFNRTTYDTYCYNRDNRKKYAYYCYGFAIAINVD